MEISFLIVIIKKSCFSGKVKHKTVFYYKKTQKLRIIQKHIVSGKKTTGAKYKHNYVK